MPVTAASEWRVSADLHRLSAAIEERFPSLASLEALCQFEGDVRQAATPGMAVLDRRFPVWMVLFDDRAFISVATELLDGRPGTRFEAVREYLRFLGDAGYSVVFDHQDNRSDTVEATLAGIVRRLASAGHSRWFDRLTHDARIAFALGVVGFGVATSLLERAPNSNRHAWSNAVAAVFFGACMAGVQYVRARRRLSGRLRQIRDDIVHGEDPVERLSFRRARLAIALEIGSVFVFGPLAAVCYAAGSWLTGTFVACLFLVAVSSLWIGSRGNITFDGQAIEGPCLRGRTRIPFGEVLRIVRWPSIDMLVVSSARERLVVRSGYDERGRLSGVLWNRVERAVAASAPHRQTDADVLLRLRDRLALVRDRGLRFGDAAWPPLWMVLRRWNHPLRRQYRWQRHLLRNGRLVLARVLTANPMLLAPPRERQSFDAPAKVIASLDSSEEAAGSALLRQVVERLNQRPPLEEARTFAQLVLNREDFSVGVEVPAVLTNGKHVVCTSVMVVRRHIPLGYLRSPWLPVLVSPARCPYVMVLPMRFWDDETRDAWKRGGELTGETAQGVVAEKGISPSAQGGHAV